MAEMLTVWPPVFVKVAVFGELVVPTSCVAYVKLEGFRATVEDATPVPVSETLCGLPTPW
jgi:hypothetical protein